MKSPGWSGTRFVLRAGKALAERRRGVRFRGTGAAHSNDRWIDVDQNSAVGPLNAHPALEAAPPEQVAYVNVLRDLLSGADRLSVSAEEAELAWRIFTPVLHAWASDSVPLGEYPAGTTPDGAGPSRHEEGSLFPSTSTPGLE